MNDPSKLKNSGLSAVKLSKSAKKITAHSDLLEDIVVVMKDMSSLKELKETQLFEVVKRVCELIENADYQTSKDELKLDKKAIAINAIVMLFPDLNNEKDKNYISQAIDTLCQSKIIKKNSVFRKVVKFVVPWLKKKLL
jgi:basic membrane lipoprotein Med (substrate-binding protein (PBP1-ABC) superfamily)